LFALSLIPLAAPAMAADPVGTWLTEAGKSHVRISRCGETLCGKIVWLRDATDPESGKPVTDLRNADTVKRNRPVLGLEIMAGMKSGGTDKWAGELYNPEDGKTYDGKFDMLDARTAKLKGCAFGGLFCKTETWVRLD
jgi:uncharacterized protein (DUF2147 family)